MIHKTLQRKQKLSNTNTGATKTGSELRCYGRVSSSAPLVALIIHQLKRKTKI